MDLLEQAMIYSKALLLEGIIYQTMHMDKFIIGVYRNESP